MRKFIIIFIILVVLGGAAFFWVRFYYPFGDDSVKDGYLNKIEHKGYIFKTWEGTLIQGGLKSTIPGAMQSPTFEFSVMNEKLAKTLQLNSGKYFVLHYKEYFAALPWRGHSKYVVDSIMSISDVNTERRSGF